MALGGGNNCEVKPVSLITNFCLFFLSFAPLWISVLFIDALSIIQGNPNKWTEYISIALILLFSVVSSFILRHILHIKEGADNVKEFEIVEKCEEKKISAEYVLSYILPLFAFDFTIWSDVVKFLIFFSVFGFLSIRHDQFSVNVLLELRGYRFYTCKLKGESDHTIQKIIICRDELQGPSNKVISARAINNEYIVMVPHKALTDQTKTPAMLAGDDGEG